MLKFKRIYYVLLLLSWFAAFVISANGQSKTFEAVYGTSTDDMGNFVQSTADGGYIICGAKGSPGTTGYYDFSLVKVDAFGAIQWTNTIGDSLHNEQAQCIRQTADGRYIVFGSRSGTSSTVAWMVKTDDSGNELWAAEQPGSNAERYGYGLVMAMDGGYQTASYDNVSTVTNYFQLQKTDGEGNIQWGPQNIVTGIGSSSALSLTADGNYISVGTSSVTHDAATGNYLSTITLVKMNTGGTTLWSKTFKSNPGHSSSNYLQGFGVQSTSDGGYVICGSTTVNSKGGSDIFLLKTDNAGDSLWSRNYGGIANDVATSVTEAPGGNLVLTGTTRSFGNGNGDIFLLRTTATGDSIWMRTFGGSGAETAGNIEATADSGFVVVGSSKSYGNGQNNMILLRTDINGRIPDASVQSSGTICSGSNTTLTAAAGYSYNWSTGQTTQSISVSQSGNYTVTVTDSYNNLNVSQSIPVKAGDPINSTAVTLSGPASFCTGGSVTLSADSGPNYNYQWLINGMVPLGAQQRSFTATEDGDYNVVISNGCTTAASPITTVKVNALPDIPVITLFGGTLMSSSSSGNQWYLNDAMIQNATDAIYMPSTDGSYKVLVTNANHCTSESDEYDYFVTGVKENTIVSAYSLFPNPASDLIHMDYSVQYNSQNYFVIYSVEGKEVYREKIDSEKGMLSVNVSPLAEGLYFSAIENNGIKTERKTLIVLHH